MLIIDLGTIEHFDDDKQQFTYETGGKVRFEYSLKAVYEWEGKWKKPFLKGELTYNEMVDFYKTMALDEFDMRFMNDDVVEIISEYIKDSSTATKFSERQSKTKTVSNKIHTAEEIYAMMFSAGIALEFEERNLNRLLVILRIISINNAPPNKMSKNETLRQNKDLNKQRKAQMNTKG